MEYVRAGNSSPRTEKIRTYCIMCKSHCPVICSIESGKFTSVTPDRDHPMGGPFCAKGAAAPDLVYDSERLDYPMRRTKPKSSRDPQWVKISWKEALDEATEKLAKIRNRWGPEAVVFCCAAPGSSPAGDYYPWLWRLANVLGTPNVQMTTHICNWHKDQGSKYTYGVGIPEADYMNSGCILVWGTNPINTGERHALEIVRAVQRGAKLIVIDPRRTPLSRKASVHLSVRPGMDLVLCLGFTNELIRRELYDKEFLTSWTNAPFLVRGDTGKLLVESDVIPGGSAKRYVAWSASDGGILIYDQEKVSYEPAGVNPLLDCEVSIRLGEAGTVRCASVFRRLKEMVSEFDLTRTSQVTSVPEEKIAEAVETMATSRPLSYYSWNGLEQHTDAMQTNRAICILYGLIGDLDRKGGNVIFPNIPSNGTVRLDFLPWDARKRRLGGPERPLGPAGTTLNGGEIQAAHVYKAILEGEPYPVKALVCFGGNPLIANGDTSRGRKAFENLEFYLHMDLYENPSAKFADILLPAASSWESEFVGKYRWKERGHVQLRKKVIEPAGERRGDLEIIFDLAVRLGLSEYFFGGDIEAAFNHMLLPLGITMDNLRQAPLGAPLLLDTTYQKYRDPDRLTAVPHGFETPTHLLEIYSTLFSESGYNPLPEYKSPPELLLDRRKYPLLLTQYKPVQFVHSSYRSVVSLRKQLPDPRVDAHPSIASELGLKEGDWVRIETTRGSIRARLVLDEGLQPDVIAAQEGWWQGCEPLGKPSYDPFTGMGSNINLIMDNDQADPISGSIAYRGIPCRLRAS